MEERDIVLTTEGYNKLEEELKYLKGPKKMQVAERIKIAREFGDLSENSEYDDAKNEQALLEAKIQDIENMLRVAKVVDDDEVSTRKVGIGTQVTVHDFEFDEDITYGIVGATEVDMKNNKISNESPVGKALIGAKKGDEVEVETPGGVIKYKILSIKRL
ncbi:transcription elongation factor GreA [Clostridium sp. CAG:465]|nr:transcription elongation factor GreA [Clostridium sp. CAG:465]